MNRPTALIFLMLLSLAAGVMAETPEAEDKSPAREKLGVRVGYLHCASDIKNQFGHGSAIHLHFTERIKPPLFLNIALGALYLGESVSDDITQFLFGPGVSDANMRILTLTAGPTFEMPVFGHGIMYLGGGAGLYSISVLLEMGIHASDTSNERFGVNLGGGYFWPLSENWSLDLNFTFHHIWTEDIDKELSEWSLLYDARELFWLFSGGDSDPNFFQFSIGAAVGFN
jgi:opacity protein-like surface antigen